METTQSNGYYLLSIRADIVGYPGENPDKPALSQTAADTLIHKLVIAGADPESWTRENLGKRPFISDLIPSEFLDRLNLPR